MIIIILAILVLLTFYSFIFIENKTVRWVAGIISLFYCSRLLSA